ncbi:MAG TPA: sugar transferase, partial [Gemmatimonadales bacterium]
MEALVERAGPSGAPASLDKHWRVDARHSALDVSSRELLAPVPPKGQWLNRSVNVLLAVVALVIVSPVLVIVALLVKLTSRGPVFYTQERVGL